MSRLKLELVIEKTTGEKTILQSIDYNPIEPTPYVWHNAAYEMPAFGEPVVGFWRLWQGKPAYEVVRLYSDCWMLSNETKVNPPMLWMKIPILEC